MISKFFRSVLFCVVLCTKVCAQNFSSDVTLVQQDANTATVLATAIDDKKKDAALLASKSAFNTLFYSGIAGIKNGTPLIAVRRSDYDYRFFSESRYLNYISGEIETVNSEKVGGKYRVTVRQTILLKALCADLEQNDIAMNPTWTDSKAVKATASLNPTIVIVPDMIDGSDLATLRQKVVEDPVLKYAVRKLTDEFNRNGYKTQDAFNILQNQINSAMMNTGNQTDVATEIMKRMPGDIVVNVDAKVVSQGSESECILTLHALEKQTSNNLSDATFPSGRYMTNEHIKLVDYAIKQIKGDFFSMLKSKFEDIIQQGRSVVIDMGLSQSVNDWDFDQESPENGNYFKDELLAWLESHCHQSVPNVTLDTDKGIQVRMNIPLWDSEKNKSYTLSNFSSDLRKFFRSQLGDYYKANVRASGQGINVTIE